MSGTYSDHSSRKKRDHLMKTASSLSRLMMLGLTCIFIGGWASSARAVLIAYDGFDYASGAVDGLGDGSSFGFAGNWTTAAVSGNVTTGLSRLPLVVTGGAADMTGATTTTNFRVLAEALSPANATETWISLLAQRTADTALTNFVGLSFYNGGTANPSTEFAISTTVQASTNPQQWRVVDLNNGGTTAWTNSGSAIVNNQVDLLVTQIVWNADGDETVNLWVNPPATGLGTPTTRSIALAGIDRLRLASQNGASFIFDELRIGESFADVMPVIPPNPDLDGNGVGISDFTLIRNNFLTANTHAMGDVNFDGFVDHADFFVWREAFLSGGGSLSAISWSSVPEPGSVLLAGIAIIGGVAVLRRRRS